MPAMNGHQVAIEMRSCFPKVREHSNATRQISHHSTFSKNRHGRFQESKLFEELFEQIVKQCVEVD
jgi:transposase